VFHHNLHNIVELSRAAWQCSTVLTAITLYMGNGKIRPLTESKALNCWLWNCEYTITSGRYATISTFV